MGDKRLSPRKSMIITKKEDYSDDEFDKAIMDSNIKFGKQDTLIIMTFRLPY